jgi:hypothetical protein
MLSWGTLGRESMHDVNLRGCVVHAMLRKLEAVCNAELGELQAETACRVSAI